MRKRPSNAALWPQWLAVLVALLLAAPLPAWAAEESGSDEGQGEGAGEQAEQSPSPGEETKEKPAEPAPEAEGKLPKDLSGYTLDQLQALLDQFRKERATIDLELAGLVGAQNEAERAILYRKRERIEDDERRVRKEIHRKRLAAMDEQVSAIRAKFAERIDQIEAKREAERAQTIQRFEKTLAENPGSALTPDILYRLATLYLEKENDEYLRRMRKYEELVDALVTQGAEVTPVEPKKDYAQAIGLYRQIADRYPDFHHIDGVLYNLAFCLGEVGDYEEANRAFQRLIESKPDSPFVPEAYVRMGEYAFDMGDYERAIERYQHVLEYRSSSFYDKALYKLGWSYYKINDFENAKTYFSQVIDYAERTRRPTTRVSRGDDLRAEAITYIAICFVDDVRYEFEGAEQAFLDYMQRLGDRKWKLEVVAAIGNVYFERANFSGARSAFNTMLAADPTNPRNPEMVKRIIESYEREQNYEQAIAEGERLARLFGAGSPWRAANADDPRAIETADDLIQAALYASATFHHENAQLAGEAQQDAKRREYAMAIESYRNYLNSYPTAKNAYEARFNLAESLYFTGRYREAAEVYLTMLEKPEGSHYQEAAASLIKSYDELLRQEGGLDKKAARDAAGKTVFIPRRELSTTARGLVDACLLYVKLFPDDNRNNPVYLARAGEIYYYHGQYDEARAIFDRLVFGPYRGTDESRIAANLTIESLKAEEKIPELENYARKIRDMGEVVTKEDVREIDVLIQDAAFVNAQKMADRGEFDNAVGEFLRAAAEHPNLENAPAALHNAAVIYEKNLNNIYKANEIYLEVARKYPKWKGSPADMFRAATNYEKVVEIEKAMGVYEEFGILFRENPEAPNALYNAGLLREKNKEYSKAIAIYKRHLDQYPNSKDAAWLTFAIARLYGEMKQDADEEAWLLRYTRSFADAADLVEAYCKLGNLYQRRGRTEDARANWARAMAVFKKGRELEPGLETKYAAEAWFRYVDQDYERYRAIRFSLPQKKMAQQLEEKAKAWKNLQAEYQQIIALGNFEWASAALHRIGTLNKDFADALFQAPVPEGLTPEEQDAYIMSLEDKAFPIQSRALEAFKANVEKAAEFRFRNSWVDASYDELRKMEPGTVEKKFELTSPGVADVLYDYPQLDMLGGD